jgi:hypothetical protein
MGNPGSYFTSAGTKTTKFVLRNGETLVWWIKTFNATSSNSFIAGEGNKFTGKLHGNTYAR